MIIKLSGTQGVEQYATTAMCYPSHIRGNMLRNENRRTFFATNGDKQPVTFVKPYAIPYSLARGFFSVRFNDNIDTVMSIEFQTLGYFQLAKRVVLSHR